MLSHYAYRIQGAARRSDPGRRGDASMTSFIPAHKSGSSGAFSIDIRSLAALRLALALLVLFDLARRFPLLVSHYSDAGVLPRRAAVDIFGRPGIFSTYMMSGSAWVSGGIFVVAGVFGLTLLLGYRTRLATAVTWFLLISLHTRNPAVNQAGDDLLGLLLFWSIFLPLSASFSIDRALNTGEDPPTRIHSVASAALLLQIAFVYWFTALLKIDPAWLGSGSAVFYALNIDQFATPLAKAALGYPSVLPPLTHITLFLEVGGPLLAFIFYRGPARALIVALMVGMHVSFAMFLELGLFAFTSMACWIVFLPSWFWTQAQIGLSRTERSNWILYYDRECLFCRKMVAFLRVFLALPELRTEPAQGVASIEADMRRVNSWVVLSPTGDKYFGFTALVQLFRASIPFRPLGWILGSPPILRFGNKCYAWIANHRSLSGRLLSPFSFRAQTWSLPRIANVLLAFLLLLVFQWNVWTISEHFQMSNAARTIVTTLDLDQKWSMFAPHPPARDGWFIAEADLNSDTPIDLITGAPVTWQKPSVLSKHYGGSILAQVHGKSR